MDVVPPVLEGNHTVLNGWCIQNNITKHIYYNVLFGAVVKLHAPKNTNRNVDTRC